MTSLRTSTWGTSCTHCPRYVAGDRKSPSCARVRWGLAGFDVLAVLPPSGLLDVRVPTIDRWLTRPTTQACACIGPLLELVLGGCAARGWTRGPRVVCTARRWH